MIELYVGLYGELGLKLDLPVKLYVDSDNVFKLNKGVTNHTGSRHYRIAQAYIAEKVKDGLIKLVHVPTEKNPADLLTKALATDVHHRHARATMSSSCWRSALQGAC